MHLGVLQVSSQYYSIHASGGTSVFQSVLFHTCIWGYFRFPVSIIPYMHLSSAPYNQQPTVMLHNALKK
jgi:hypothetical protein